MEEPVPKGDGHGFPILSIAPMIQWTDRHYRYMMRLITKETQLYTEMVMDDPILYNEDKLANFIGHNDCEYPLALQLGGHDPVRLGAAAEICERYGKFNIINLNAGCPSDKAKKMRFGAQLMRDPERVRMILHEMGRRAPNTTISVKCRIGICKRESYEELLEFVDAVRSAGVRHLVVHARKCVLKGLSPAQNRTIPPLKHEVVHSLKRDFPDMHIVLNGGLGTFDEAASHLYTDWRCPGGPESTYPAVDGVMVGRAAYHNPLIFQDADRRFFGKANPAHTRREVLEKYLDYATQALDDPSIYGTSVPVLMKPLHNFFTGQDGVRQYKYKLDALLHPSVANMMPFEDLVWEAIDAAGFDPQLLDREMAIGAP